MYHPRPHPDTCPISFTYPPVACMWVVTLHSLFLYSDLPLPCHPPSYWLRLFFEPTFSLIIPQHFSNLVHSTHTYLPMKMEQTECSERRHLNFRRRGITPKKAYNIQNTAKVWNLNFVVCLLAGCWWNSVIQYCNSLQVNLINFTLLLNCSTACINAWLGKNVT